ncbi:MAG: hypothetical protein ACRCXX_04145 [Cetobacterium sp.]|uniref:hypothetical protein n=1 Tax=Cetobacterium sp. TaxID=2071632 RepID=UPI003F2E7E72
MHNDLVIILSIVIVVLLGIMTVMMFAMGNLVEGCILLIITAACVTVIRSGKGFAYEYTLQSSSPLWLNVVDYDKSGNLYLGDGSVETITGLKENFEAISVEFVEDDTVDIAVETYIKKFISGPIHIEDQRAYKLIMHRKYFPYDNQEVLR